MAQRLDEPHQRHQIPIIIMHDRNLRNASRNRHTGTCVNSILFGNGLNLLSEDCPTWKELLSDISDEDNAPILEGIPPTLQYEQVYLSPNASFSGLTNKTEETTLKNAVKRRLRKLHSNGYYERLRSMDVNVFMTTNYYHAFYDNDEDSVVDYDGTEKLYSIRRWKKRKIPWVPVGKLKKFIEAVSFDTPVCEDSPAWRDIMEPQHIDGVSPVQIMRMIALFRYDYRLETSDDGKLILTSCDQTT